MALVSLQLAKAHLRITTDDGDSDIYAKKQQAEAIVLDKCNTTARVRALSASWTEATVPGAVQSAILLTLTHLYENRGNDMQTQAAVDMALAQIIGPNRDSVVA